MTKGGREAAMLSLGGEEAPPRERKPEKKWEEVAAVTAGMVNALTNYKLQRGR